MLRRPTEKRCKRRSQPPPQNQPSHKVRCVACCMRYEHHAACVCIKCVPLRAMSMTRCCCLNRHVQVLISAAYTTLENETALATMIRSEAERQQADAALARAGRAGHALPAGTPAIRFHSRRGRPDTICFTEVDAFPATINSALQPTLRMFARTRRYWSTKRCC